MLNIKIYNLINKYKMNVLYVTSFNENMYIASGKNLINSFIKSNTDDYLVVCYEGFKFNDKINNNKILSHNLDKSDFLQNWLFNNKNIIPDKLGGDANKQINPYVYNEWNYKASLWFRKIASLEYVKRMYNDYFDAIIWIDSDCSVIQKIPKSLIYTAFNKKEVFYHLGQFRISQNMPVESSFIGFSKNSSILTKVINSYSSGDFKKFKFWDDGHIFKEFLNNTDNNDLIKVQLNHNNVIEHSLFSKYIIHHKGLHKRLNIHNL
jgi:flagellar hook protein FlgE